MTTSNRALARTLGVSETAVRKAEKVGRIRRAGDGSWEVERVRAAWHANTDAGQQRAPPLGLRPVPEAAVGAVRETNLIDTVNTVGLPMYAGQLPRLDGSAIDVKTDASILPVNKRPRLAVRLYSSN